MKKGQIGAEYLILMSFITLAVSVTLLLSQYYASSSETKIRLNQIENFANKITNSAESVYYSGEPSKTTITAFLPEGVNSINISDDVMVMSYYTPDGESVRAFRSNVPLNGTIDPGTGVKRLEISAKENFAKIKEIN